MRLPLVKGSKISDQAEWRDALPVNVTAFAQEVDGDPGFIRTLDGMEQYGTGLGTDRGGIWSARFTVHLRISGQSLIEIDQLGNVINVGGATSISGSAQVQFASSFNSVAFVANGEYYRYVPTTGTLSLIAKPVGAGLYNDICFIDGYYILSDEENLWSTEIADETTISSIAYAGSDFAPDEIVGIGKATDNKLIAFNRYTTERFYNNAGPQFPFARIPSAAIPIGIVGPKAKVNVGDGAWAIFGGSKEFSPTFYMLTNSYQKISTKEIDSVIDGYSDYELENIIIEFRDTRDQRLVICHLPRDVLVYDLTFSQVVGQNIWYQWKSDNGPWRSINGVYDPRNVDNSASAWIYGDKKDSRIGKLAPALCTQYGEALEWSVKTPIVRVGGVVKAMELQSAPGHSTAKSPKVFISTTKDGVLFGPEVLISSGASGEYQKRIIALQLGDYPNWFGLRIRGFSKSVTSLAACEIQ